MPIQQMIVQTLGHHLCRTDRIRRGTRQAVLLSAFIAEASKYHQKTLSGHKKIPCSAMHYIQHCTAQDFLFDTFCKADIHSPLSQLHSI